MFSLAIKTKINHLSVDLILALILIKTNFSNSICKDKIAKCSANMLLVAKDNIIPAKAPDFN